MSLKKGLEYSPPFSPVVGLVGRFNPCHNGHINLFKQALKLSNELGLRGIVIFVGSWNNHSSEKRTRINPLLSQERWDLLIQIIASEGLANQVFLIPLIDQRKDEDWTDNLFLLANQYGYEIKVLITDNTKVRVACGSHVQVYNPDLTTKDGQVIRSGAVRNLIKVQNLAWRDLVPECTWTTLFNLQNVIVPVLGGKINFGFNQLQ